MLKFSKYLKKISKSKHDALKSIRKQAMGNKFHQKLSELNKVFSPSAPIISKNLFFGRLEQISKILEAINERGQHAVLFGERGVGKTSLANIISDII